MMTTVALCTHNQNKVKELKALLPDFLVCSYKDVVGCDISVNEDGSTFEENAIKKVEAMPLQKDVIYISDDSGLQVEALNGAPGIYSARLGGDNITSEQQCRIILDRLDDHPIRRAQFVCVIALRFPEVAVFTTRGVVYGTISHQLMGYHGFGYDPIFIPDGYQQTFSQLGDHVKNRLSHRYLAMCEALEILKKRLLRV